MPAEPFNADQAPSSEAPGSAPGEPRKTRWVLISLAIVAVLAFGSAFWSMSGSRFPMKLNAEVSSYFSRRAGLTVSNSTSRAVVLWQPWYVERQEDATIVAGSGSDSPVLLTGKNRGTGRTSAILSVQLTGTNYGKWRLRTPVSTYGPLALIDSLFRQPQGWTLRSRLVRSTLRHLSRTAVTERVDEASPVRVDDERRGAFINLSQAFRRHSGRWPTNVTELQDYATATAQPSLEDPYRTANLEISTNGMLTARFARGGFVSFGAGPLSPPAPGTAHADRLAEFRHNALHRRSESMTFIFILRNFRSYFKRWPGDMKELADFVRVHRQPAIPPKFNDAKLNLLPDGGLKIVYDDGNGEVSLH